jgi:hypothetical protein
MGCILWKRAIFRVLNSDRYQANSLILRSR